MANLYLLEGPVGAGKSTWGRKLGIELSIPHLVLDDWMTRLFKPDRPEHGVFVWYAERKKRCLQQMWNTACAMLDVDMDVILELGLVQRTQREMFYTWVQQKGYTLHVYVLDAPREIRRTRVQERNVTKGATFSMEVPEDIFELASDLWEPVDTEEFGDSAIHFISTAEPMF